MKILSTGIICLLTMCGAAAAQDAADDPHGTGNISVESPAVKEPQFGGVVDRPLIGTAYLIPSVQDAINGCSSTDTAESASCYYFFLGNLIGYGEGQAEGTRRRPICPKPNADLHKAVSRFLTLAAEVRQPDEVVAGPLVLRALRETFPCR